MSHDCNEKVHGESGPDDQSRLAVSPDFCETIIENVRNRENDYRARQRDAAHGEYFGHGIGHGIGLEIHELCQPALPFRTTKLVNNMVHTVEPGIYLPDKGGVRIEDDILVHDQTPETLSTLPKDELISL